MVSVFLVMLGGVLIVLGLSFPFLEKLGVGRLPGDFLIEGERYNVYIPVTTSLIVSLLLSLFFFHL